MASEIKFRVFSKTKQKWLNSIVISCDSGIPLILYTEVDDNKKINHQVFTLEGFEPIIQQFTGLKDKNGKEIYDGDIIEWEEDIDWSKKVPTIPEVVNENDKFKCKGAVVFDAILGAHIKFQSATINLYEIETPITIIGNICQ